jgi:hypothetical protein
MTWKPVSIVAVIVWSFPLTFKFTKWAEGSPLKNTELITGHSVCSSSVAFYMAAFFHWSFRQGHMVVWSQFEIMMQLAFCTNLRSLNSKMTKKISA